ncbi:MAG TPA: serine/threonine-protein kinase [Gaiellaceae bacterium]|nr:serine/threonine-protein kinase [Gaiellaceae bacterium]
MSAPQTSTKRYRPVRLLGHGGMATVELAHDTELDRPVAIKRLAENLAANEEYKQRFLREARLAARLSHPNIVAVYDAGAEHGVPYIVMEYVEGETVSDLLRRRGRLEPAEAVAQALQACSGLETAHEAGLVHRDIKPQNLLITPDGTLKIADFGIARSLDGTKLTQAGTVLGTAAYLAPEQAAGEQVTATADIYALGAVLYELLTGRPPYEADSLAELFAKQTEGSITPLRELAPVAPARLEDAVMHALARAPEYRPESAAAFAAELAATPTVVTTVDQSLARTKPMRRVRSRGRAESRRRRWVLSAAAIFAAALVALILALSLGGGSKSPKPVAPPSTSGSTAQQARAFSAWLRGHAAGG